MIRRLIAVMVFIPLLFIIPFEGFFIGVKWIITGKGTENDPIPFRVFYFISNIK